MHLKEIISEARAVPIQSHLAIADLGSKIDAEGKLAEAEQTSPNGLQSRLNHVLDELAWYSDALAAARAR
jgi:hypothetical protein